MKKQLEDVLETEIDSEDVGKRGKGKRGQCSSNTYF